MYTHKTIIAQQSHAKMLPATSSDSGVSILSMRSFEFHLAISFGNTSSFSDRSSLKREGSHHNNNWPAWRRKGSTLLICCYFILEPTKGKLGELAMGAHATFKDHLSNGWVDGANRTGWHVPTYQSSDSGTMSDCVWRKEHNVVTRCALSVACTGSSKVEPHLNLSLYQHRTSNLQLTFHIPEPTCITDTGRFILPG